MASSSGALEVMGHNKQRLRISPFSGTESFPVYQSQLQQQGFFTFIPSMDIKCEAEFTQLLADISEQAADQGSAAKQAALQVLLAKKKTYQTDDYNFQVSLQLSLKGIAQIIAFPPPTAFVLQEKPGLPGSQAYQRLVKEYGEIPTNVLDKFIAKEQIMSYFSSPNLGSPQLDVFLVAKVEEHLTKYKFAEEVKNDFYLEALNEFVKHLPNNTTFLAVQVKTRKDLAKGTNRAKEIFIEIAKDVQASFKALQEIEGIQYTASKAFVPPTKIKGLPKQNGVAAAQAHNQQKVVASAKAKPTGLKPKDFCRKFNAEGCTRTATECKYKHEKTTPAILQREYEASQIRQAAHFANSMVI